MASGFSPSLAATQASTAPRALEEIVAGVWADVLEVDGVGVDDDFFAIGGHSLNATRAVARLRSSLGIELALVDLLECPTPAALAARIRGGAPPVATPDTPTRRETRHLLPFQYWYFLESGASEQEFTVEALLELPEALDEEALEHAVDAALARHEALRSGYRTTAGGWHVETVPVRVADVLRVVEVTAPATSAKRELDGLAADLRASLDIGRGHVLRIAAVRTPPRDPDLVLVVVQHVACDGFALDVLVGDLETAYGNYRNATPDPRPAPAGALWWAERLGSYAESAESDAERRYWCALPPTRPFALRRADAPTEAGASTSLEHSLPAADARDLAATGEALDASLNEVVLACLAAAHMRTTGQSVAVIGNNNHGRSVRFDGVGCADTVGWLAFNVPLVLDAQAPDLPGVVASVRDQIRAVPRSGVAALLLRYAQSDDPAAVRLREIAGHAALTVNFVGALDGIQGSSRGWAQSTIELARPPAIPRRGNVRILCRAEPDGALVFAWAFNPAWYEAARIGDLASAFADALSELART